MKIYNVKIKTMDSDRRVIENGWVEITDGIISAVESGSPEAVTAEDINGNGRTVYPGFIDIHTHLGLSTSGVGMEGEDFNEESEPCTAHIRIVDAFCIGKLCYFLYFGSENRGYHKLCDPVATVYGVVLV